MATVTIIFPSKYVNSEGVSAISLRIRIKEQKREKNTGIKIHLNDWDSKKMQVKKSHPQAADYNLILQNALARVNEIFVKYRLSKNLELTADLFDKEYDNPNTGSNYKEWIYEEAKRRVRAGEITQSSYKAHKSIFDKLFQFRKNIDFYDLTPQLLDDYSYYLKVQLKNQQNTVHNSLKTLKSYTNIAEKTFKFNNPFRGYKLTKERTNVTFLTEAELSKLFKYYDDINSQELEASASHLKTLRAFLFACVTGLRMSDLLKVKKEDVQMFRGVPNLMVEETKKKNVRYYIRLHKRGLQLIDDENKFLDKGIIFKKRIAQKMNDGIKDICLNAGISSEKAKLISFHKARHTFATIALQHGTLKDVQELLNHDSIRSTEMYIHAVPSNKERIMSVFDKF